MSSRWYLCGHCQWSQHGVASRELCMCQCHGGKQAKGKRRKKPTAAGRERIVAKLIARDGDRCVWCGIRLRHPWRPTIEHWLPRSLGGSNRLPNLRLACEWCNSKRGVMEPEVFMVWLEKNWVPTSRRRRVLR